MAERDIIREAQDYRMLEWNDISFSPGTPGMLMKTLHDDVYYKLSCFDSYAGFYGHESVNELIVSRLLDTIGIPHVADQLIHALIRIDGKEYTTWMCSSRNFRKKGESKMGLDVYYDLNKKENESPLDFCIRMGWKTEISQMMLADFLVSNKDRHGANIEVLLDEQGNARMAPLFDFGLSLLFSKNGEFVEDVADYNVMADYPANNYLGSRFLFKNLELMPELPRISERTEGAKAVILEGLEDILPKAHIDKAWEMIEKRWDYYEAFYRRQQDGAR